ncbi:MAG: PDZ domain-containing protein [Syntrophorhabdales bacterium]|jgi:membrane-associated protease RseP (regulator of RpoE activity)
MRYWRFAIVIITLGSLSLSCAPRASVYQNWGSQLRELPLHGGRVDDVSLLLGAPPTRCEPVEASVPVIGVIVDPRQEKPIVTFVQRNGPGYQAGIRPGDIIKSVAGQPVATPKEGVLTIRNNAKEGEPIEIETNRGTVSAIPKVPKTEQCYWEVHAGQIATTGSSTYVNRYAGASSSGGAAYERFFRASCRIQDGFVGACQANWQQ